MCLLLTLSTFYPQKWRSGDGSSLEYYRVQDAQKIQKSTDQLETTPQTTNYEIFKLYTPDETNMQKTAFKEINISQILTDVCYKRTSISFQ